MFMWQSILVTYSGTSAEPFTDAHILDLDLALSFSLHDHLHWTVTDPSTNRVHSFMTSVISGELAEPCHWCKVLQISLFSPV